MPRGLVIVWSIAIATGSYVLWNHAFTPDAEPQAVSHWPVATRLPRQNNHYTLVLFAHPHCPCTRSTVRELERLLPTIGESCDLLLVFVEPPGRGEAWAHTDLWRSALAIPNARVIVDRDGREAQRFCARTSGLTLLFDPAGDCVFRGGITAARGHEGESLGLTAFVNALHGVHQTKYTSVFGCPLFTPGPPKK